MCVTISRFSAVSGAVFRNGSAISRMGRICATDRAILDSAENAPISSP